MTREEFVTRTGLNPTDAAFEYINRVYMAAGDTMMKDDFCKEFKKNEGVRDSKIVEALTEQVESLNAGLENLAKQANTEMELRIKAASDMADFLIEQAQATGSFDIRAKAISLIGEQEYLRRLIKTGQDLWTDDRKALEKYLTK